ncbi:glycosyltransferase family 2 protein [Mycolicibacterium pyrenivorans]|uniref:glycosyltransferase family 2 protein n=1 Tax=Mycolicibacterium pyrenivorans TaxID=187102 RepID=UPI0021F33AAA|nr:glycosyltransferase family 2 protein [Mycolicibacterium pyrenivorans]MCV7155357.1 glycosyltransferase family 2 protein [Mycolicibacterium pyrenivorans]
MTKQPPRPADPVAPAISISVVICCYTWERRQRLGAAVDAALAQTRGRDELIVVVDGNEQLFRVLAAAYGSRVTFLQNAFRRGLSGARNTGLLAASGEVLVFLDDDAVLRPAALDAVRTAFADPLVAALGGAVHPAWHDGSEPGWFPAEFGWVVGCDYRGLPPDGAAIRNPIGAAMAVRRAELTAIGGFSDRLGRVGALPTGCEETMMGIELSRRDPQARIVRQTAFAVSHSVPRDRTTVAYFVRRCFHEGRSKAILTGLCGQRSSLESERTYTTRTLPSGLWRARRRPARMLALAAGLLVTAAGYLAGLVETTRRRRSARQ